MRRVSPAVKVFGSRWVVQMILFWKQESFLPSPCSVAVARSPDSLTQNAWKSLLQSLWLEKSLPSFNLWRMRAMCHFGKSWDWHKAQRWIFITFSHFITFVSVLFGSGLQNGGRHAGKMAVAHTVNTWDQSIDRGPTADPLLCFAYYILTYIRDGLETFQLSMGRSSCLVEKSTTFCLI